MVSGDAGSAVAGVVRSTVVEETEEATFNPATMTTGSGLASEILADLDALKREVDAAMGKV